MADEHVFPATPTSPTPPPLSGASQHVVWTRPAPQRLGDMPADPALDPPALHGDVQLPGHLAARLLAGTRRVLSSLPRSTTCTSLQNRGTALQTPSRTASLTQSPAAARLPVDDAAPNSVPPPSTSAGKIRRCFRRRDHQSTEPAPPLPTRPVPSPSARRGEPAIPRQFPEPASARRALMPIEYTHVRQVGVRPPLYYFERALADLAIRCGRMVPEIKGVRTERSADSEMAWLVTCVVRGSGISPATEEFTIDVMERTWTDGMIRVSQEALARLAFLHPEVVAGTGYQYLGQRDLAGKPVAGAPHADTAHQLHHMEYLLHHTQTQQDRARERCDLQEDEIATLRAQLAASQADLASERKLRFAARRRVTRLKAKVTSLEALTTQMEATIEELEDDGEDLRKENEALLSDDDDYEDEDFDMEPDTEDEAFINDEDEEPEPLLSEEDPEEPAFVEEDAPPAPEVPVVDLDDF
ncbi:hypothetical protein QYE76_038789 [Lolium multiflorum]|uniref:Uncharacterized protein n=1 Tax=Lolium multiflorum TaxID=4521 RepID=A0AAD8WT73_LOLMU|nr:hypothetical protein QYE76_051723 [Lolium multiflorum]KAK1677941.1 hypothetical protein QYE76_038789 [Lolium multiflorum]